MTTLTTMPHPAKAFLKPNDFSTPMGRADFWIFYAGYVLAICAIAIFLPPLLIRAELLLGLPATSVISLFSILLLFYLAATLLAAISRRMVDSGYRRAGLVLSVSLAVATMASFTSDILVSYRHGADPKAALETSYSEITFTLSALTILSLFYVFLGTIRPSRRPSSDTLADGSIPGA